jgi:predicted ATPase/DNA-binding winged helix-turn-helix (wHTH) protein
MDLIRVGAFEVYASDRRLCADGKPIEIGARAFDLLLVLAENPGRLVTKATLLERVWPRLVVDENNLPAQVASLRRVLGAGAIRTVPRFGYRLDLPVSRSIAATGPGTNEPATTASATVPVHGAPAAHARKLVGRDIELGAVRDALERERLVTLVGAAGVGKSRLAREILAVEREHSGVAAALVPLEPLESVDHVPSAIALALGVSMPGHGDRFLALQAALEHRRVLVVLDGAEHLAGELAAPLAALVNSVAGARILVTSQTPLGRLGESVYRLGPLPAAEAARLFAQRAAQADQRFALGPANEGLIEEICRRLDGNPLAIELAAARVPAFGLAALLARLDDRFRLLKVGGPARDQRHGVLQAAFDWSYGLLGPVEQRVFDRLGAFAGSFALDVAAQAVADGDVDLASAIDIVGRLVDRSLVTVLPQEPVRYSLLETARCYARSRLESAGTGREAELRMAQSMLALLDRAHEEYWSADEALWLDRYVPEIDNVRAALDWARGNDAGLAVALYGSAWPLFVETDLHAEARAAHDEAVGLLSDSLPPARIARFWEAIATYDSGRQVDRARYAADIASAAHARSGDQRARYYGLLQYSLNAFDDLDDAGRALATARGIEQPAWPARLLAHGAIVDAALRTSAGDYAQARAAYRRALDFALAASERQALAATVNIVELDVASGAIAGALQLARPLAMSLRHSGRRETRVELLSLLFGALLLAGEIDEARAAGMELYDLARRFDVARLYPVLDAMALLAALEGRHDVAARICASAETAHVRHGQVQRRPAGERIRASVLEILDRKLGAGWRARSADGAALPGEEEACAMALGAVSPGR